MDRVYRIGQTRDVIVLGFISFHTIEEKVTKLQEKNLLIDMVRGKTWFRCPCCGTRFESLDIEDNATVFSMPMPCPRCGTKSPAIGPLGWIRTFIGKIAR